MNTLDKKTYPQKYTSSFFRQLCAGSFVLCLLAARLSAQATLLAASELPNAPEAQTSKPDTASIPSVNASIDGTVAEASGAVIAGATITLEDVASHEKKVTVSDRQGFFGFASVSAGIYILTIQATGFAPFIQSNFLLHAGQNMTLPSITLQVAAVGTTVYVNSKTQIELAQEQIHAEEKQRFLYVAPNFYVTYLPHPAPLTAKQKLGLASRLLIDPYVFVATGAVAGIEQATDIYNGYGQEVTGYARRYGAAYGNAVAGIFIGAGVLPALLRQDPRYFYKGTGSVGSRIGYAMLTIVRIKGDNGRWQPNYSGVLGDFAAAGISNSYLAASDREGIVTLTDNVLIGFAFRGVAALEQEFLFRHLTTHSQTSGTVGHDSQNR